MEKTPLERKHLGADELSGWRLAVYIVIFEADTRLGKAFDVGLILAIILSVAAVMAESVAGVRADFRGLAAVRCSHGCRCEADGVTSRFIYQMYSAARRSTSGQGSSTTMAPPIVPMPPLGMVSPVGLS